MLAFATGECGDERWGELAGAEFASANVAALEGAGIDYIVSTGGQAGVFNCSSDAGMARFLERYRTRHLVGIDFDIEGPQTAAQIESLMRRAAFAQRHMPALRISFTLATHAAGDGSRRSLNATGAAVVGATASMGLDKVIINLMTMDYGPPDAGHCITTGHDNDLRCEMGLSALQAAENVHLRYGLPVDRIAITPMLGENDVVANRFLPADAELLAARARRIGLAGIHWWSLDRDRPCRSGAPRVSPDCHGLPGVEKGTFEAILGR